MNFPVYTTFDKSNQLRQREREKKENCGEIETTTGCHVGVVCKYLNEPSSPAVAATTTETAVLCMCHHHFYRSCK